MIYNKRVLCLSAASSRRVSQQETQLKHTLLCKTVLLMLFHLHSRLCNCASETCAHNRNSVHHNHKDAFHILCLQKVAVMVLHNTSPRSWGNCNAVALLVSLIALHRRH